MTMIVEVDDDWDFAEERDSDHECDEADLEEMCLNKFHHWQTLQSCTLVFVRECCVLVLAVLPHSLLTHRVFTASTPTGSA